MYKNITQYIRHNLKSGKSVMILIAVVMLICGSVPSFMQLGNYLDSFELNIGTEKMRIARVIENFLLELFNMNNQFYSILLSIIAAVAGLVLAYSLFFYFRKKNSSDFFLSLPLTRTEAYIANFVSGILYFVIPLIAVSAVTLVGLNIMGSYKFVNVAKLLLGTVENNGMLAMLGNSLAFFLLFFALGTVAVLLTSNGINALVVYGTLNFYPIVFMLLLIYSARIFNSDIVDFTDSIVLNCLHITPAARMLAYDSIPPTASTYIGAVIAAIVIAVIGCYLCNIRPAESWSSAIVFKPLRLCLQYMYCFICAFAGALFFYEINDRSLVNIIVGAAIGLVLSFMILNIIFERDVKAIFKKPLRLAWSALIVLVMFVVIIMDSFGIFRYREPAVGDVDYVYASLNHAVVFNVPVNGDENALLSKIEDPDGKQAAIKLYTLLHELNRYDDQSSFMKIDPPVELSTFEEILGNYFSNYTNRLVVKMMRDGKEIRPLRTDYFIRPAFMYDVYKTIYDCGDYVDPMITMLENAELVSANVFVHFAENSDIETLDKKSAVPEELRLALIEDYKNASFEDLQDITAYKVELFYNLPTKAQSAPLIIARDHPIMTTYETVETVDYNTVGAVDYNYTLQIRIPACFTNTLALIEKHCDTEALQNAAQEVIDNITSVQVTIYSEDGNSVVDEISVTDPAEISEIMAQSIRRERRSILFAKENVVLRVFYTPETYYDPEYMENYSKKYNTSYEELIASASETMFLKHTSTLY